MPFVHARLQAPQLSGLLERFTHAVPHWVSPEPQKGMHTPLLQTGVVPEQGVWSTHW